MPALCATLRDASLSRAIRSAYSTNLLTAARRSTTSLATPFPAAAAFRSVAVFFAVIYSILTRPRRVAEKFARAINTRLEPSPEVRVATTTLNVFSDSSADHIGYGTLLNIRNGFESISLLYRQADCHRFPGLHG
jgi:hypothetical protein